MTEPCTEETLIFLSMSSEYEYLLSDVYRELVLGLVIEVKTSPSFSRRVKTKIVVRKPRVN